jgi:outer membrane lipoprotein carrier protein
MQKNIFIALSLLLAAPAFAADSGAEDVLRRFARPETLVCSFVQTSENPMFAAPLVSRGRLVFRAPDFLRWEYTQPSAQGFILAGGCLTRREGDKLLSAAEDPVGLALGRRLLGWIGADTEAIRRDYEPSILGQEPLELRLVPRSAQVREVVEELHIRLDGNGVVSRVLLKEAGGGMTRLDFSDSRLNGPLDAADLSPPAGDRVLP